MALMEPSAVLKPLTLHLASVLRLTDDQLFELCQRNRDLRIEREPTGDLTLMTPVGGKSANRNARILARLNRWAEQDGSGETFDSSGGFLLPDGAMRSPDAAWVERSRLTALAVETRERFLPLCPDFVLELRSPSDPLADLQAKMREYLDNGARLGWLIDPLDRRVYVFRPGLEVEMLDEPASISGSPELPGFELELERIWEPGW
jgi:Uma2 family endonuclease